MRPTIGRIVYVRLPGSTGQVFGRGGGGFHSSIVQSADVNDPEAEFTTVNWDWMPYQKANP